MTALFLGILAASLLFFWMLWEFAAFREAVGWVVLAIVAVIAAISISGQVVLWWGKRTNRWDYR